VTWQKTNYEESPENFLLIMVHWDLLVGKILPAYQLMIYDVWMMSNSQIRFSANG